MNNVSTSARPPLSAAWKARLCVWPLAAIFLIGGVAKLSSLGAFERYIVTHAMAPDLTWAAYEARLLIALELSVGLALLQRAWVHRFLLPATMVLLAGFSLFLAYLGFVKGETASCHCLGEWLPMSPLESLGKNLILIGVAWYGRRHTRHWPPGRWPVPVTMALVAVIAVFVFFPTRSRPGPDDGRDGSRFARFTAFSNGSVDLTEGTVIVGFMSLDCDHCRAVTRELVASADALPPVYLVCLGAESMVMEFQIETGSDFPYLIAEPGTYFEFIGNLPPRVYLLRDGKEVAHWDEAAFSVDAVQAAATP